jgi:hypothetical protein
MLPTFISGWDSTALKARVVFGAPDQATLTPPETALERRYALRAVKQRLHQASFREAVITAYNGRCALSGLPEPLLLDAAHIVADKDERLGQPVVPNGIPLSKIHCRLPGRESGREHEGSAGGVGGLPRQHETSISGRAAYDARQHARQRRAVARGVQAVPQPGNPERRPVARSRASASVRPTMVCKGDEARDRRGIDRPRIAPGRGWALPALRGLGRISGAAS